jgi:hypothetical protein
LISFPLKTKIFNPFFLKVNIEEIKNLYRQFTKKSTFNKRDSINTPEELLDFMKKINLLSILFQDWSGIDISDEGNEKEIKSESESRELLKNKDLTGKFFIYDRNFFFLIFF